MAIVGYWRLNGNSNDASGNGYNGTDTNMTYGQGYGILNGGAYFNGSSSRIAIGTSVNLSGAMTVSALVRTTDITKSQTICADRNASTGAWGQWSVHFRVATSGIEFIWKDSGSNLACKFTEGHGIVNNKWAHVVVTRDSSRNIEFIVDGKSIPSSWAIGSNSVTIQSSPWGVAIGRSGANNSLYWNGAIDNVILDNSAWSNAQIKNEYSRIKGFF